jgi:hypothetical protein
MAFRGFFHPAPSEAATPPAAVERHAPGTRIGYDPLLIKRLRLDHQRLLELFTQAQTLLTTRDYDGVKRKLGEMRIVLQDHLMTASVKFYVYVSRQLAYDPGKTALINEHRRSMLVNSRLIMDFLRTYSVARLDDSFAEVFQTEFLAIGATLVQHIEREESAVYPLYQASYGSPAR